MMSLDEAARATGGHGGRADVRFVAVSTDSRSVGAGELFVALRGARFDGHEFVAAAAARGAAAALVARDWTPPAGLALPLLVVEDTLRALGALAAHWRARFELPLIGITGSNGKTTVKEMCAAILRAHAGAAGSDGAQTVLATAGNLNNDIGVPLMLLRLTAAHRAAVIEMGMNKPGEIAYLTALARPTVALVTNAQRAHLEGMGSLAAVAQEKGTIYSGLGAQGVAVINADDPHAGSWRRLNGARRIVSFGLGAAAEVRADYRLQGFGAALMLHTPWGDGACTLRVAGLHNVRNALAAAAATLAAGVPLASVTAGLGAYAGTAGRLQMRPGAGGATLIDDTYNANPDSVRAAIDVLGATAGRKILVLGDMGEVGSQGAQFHDEVGGYAKSEGIDRLYALGELAELAARNFGPGGAHFREPEALLAALRGELDATTTVLVKGSRFMRMERIADALAAQGTATQ